MAMLTDMPIESSRSSAPTTPMRAAERPATRIASELRAKEGRRRRK